MNAPHLPSKCGFQGRQSAGSAWCVAALAAMTLCGGTASAQTVADFFPEVAHLLASDPMPGDFFGTAISISGDTIVAGAPYDDGSAGPNQGCAYVLLRQPSGSWLQVAKLTPLDALPGDFFGASVAIHGGTIVVGADGDDVSAVEQGSAYVFERQTSGSWLQVAKLVASDAAANDYFGFAVSVDHNTVVVGAYGDDVASAGEGSAYVYERQIGGSWSAAAKLVAADATADDQFGYSVAVELGTIVVGARNADGAYANTGGAYIFERQLAGTWSQAAKMTAADGWPSDLFGSSVAVRGGTIVVGAPDDDLGALSNSGSAYVFERQSNTSWLQTTRLAATDAGSTDYFGTAVAVDANTIVVGAWGADITANNQGSAYVFERQADGSWEPSVQLLASSPAVYDFFGDAVAIDAGTIVIGSTSGNDTANDQGTADVFETSVARNLDLANTGYTSLSDAIADALPGEHIAIRNQALQLGGIIDISSKPLTFVGVEPLTMLSDLMLRLATDSSVVKSPDVAAAGLAVGGALVAPVAGTLTFEDLSVVGSGQFMQRGATLLVNQDVRTQSGGTCYLSGEILADLVATDVGGQNRVSETTDIFSDYSNAGATIVQRGTLYIYGNLTNTGTMTGDVNTGLVPPSPGDGFNVGGDYVVGAGASLTMPDPVWWLRVGGNLDIAINDPARFVMAQATIELTGLGVAPSQPLEVLSADLGAVMAGFAPTNFPIGALRIRSGATAILTDSHDNATGLGNEAIYAHSLDVPAGASLSTGGLKIYVESATINGTVSNPDDIIIVTGTPPCIADLNGDGQVNGQDLGVLLVMWGPCSVPCLADINTDGAVNGIDLGLMLTGWGSCSQ